MGSTSKLIKTETGMMYCDCPYCDEKVPVYDDYDLFEVLEDGVKKYFVRCDNCGQWFETSIDF